MTMRVLLTGADGYIGAIMGPKLIEAGHEVTGLDTGFYRRGWLFDDGRTHPAVFSGDQRKITVDDLRGFDAVVHLAELSNDPIGENDPGLTMDINHKGSVGLAEKARAAGVAVELKVWPVVPHVWQMMIHLPEARRSVAAAVRFLREASAADDAATGEAASLRRRRSARRCRRGLRSPTSRRITT